MPQENPLRFQDRVLCSFASGWVVTGGTKSPLWLLLILDCGAGEGICTLSHWHFYSDGQAGDKVWG